MNTESAHEKKKVLNWLFWGLIVGVIFLNIFLLFRFKQESILSVPFEDINISKPTLLIIMDENECATCVRNLFVLNDIYTTLNEEGKIDVIGIIVSHGKTDYKNISKAFLFPVKITDNFNIFQRLNLNRTPLMVGITSDRRIVFCDLVPFETSVSKEFIEKGVLDRLYYSLSLD